MKKVRELIARDLWIVLLDAIAVNAAYFLALIIRFYENKVFRNQGNYYMDTFWQFMPFYTVLCLVVFALFRLYGGMWRYAGINDMNRIIGANVVTTVIQVVGMMVAFPKRMPIPYYVIGAILQFLLITLIRFGYRILLVEKKKIASRKTDAVPALVVGAGEAARRMINHLEDSGVYRPVAMADGKSTGRKTLNGIPVVADPESVLKKVKAVFIADDSLSPEERKSFRERAEAEGIEVQDYTGYFSNVSGKVPLTSLLELASGRVTVCADGREETYESGADVLKAISGRYEIAKVEDLKIELRKSETVPFSGFDAWAKQHKEQTGEDVSFF